MRLLLHKKYLIEVWTLAGKGLSSVAFLQKRLKRLLPTDEWKQKKPPCECANLNIHKGANRMERVYFTSQMSLVSSSSAKVW